MKTNDCRDGRHEPQAIDLLLTDTDLDEIDRALDDHIEVDPFNREPSSRKSDKELGRLLSILDNLPRRKDADES
ncbi:MAG: hypothetical protein V4819_01470 [Verrucomicrobiota bacterium]